MVTPQTEAEYCDWVAEHARAIGASGASFTTAAKQMIAAPTDAGGETTFTIAIPTEYGGGERMYATRVLLLSPNDFPADAAAVRDDLFGAATERLARDLRAALTDGLGDAHADDYADDGGAGA